MTIAPAMLAAISTGVQVVGSLSEGAYKSRVAANNAAIAEENAKQAVTESYVAAQDQDYSATQQLGQLAASAGASGLALAFGSKQLQQQGASELAARDRGYTVFRGQKEAREHRLSAAEQRAAGKFAKTEALFNVGSSLISGAGKINNIKAARINTVN